MPSPMTLAGIERIVQDNQIEYYLSYGWKFVEQDAKVSKSSSKSKKKAAMPAETAPEAATEDLGNAIKGD